MLQQIINLVKEQAGDVIDNNPEVPADKKEQVKEVAGNSVVDGLQGMLQGGNVKDLLKLFTGGTENLASNPVTQQVNHSMVDNLTSKAGLSSGQAGGLASAIVPMILGKLVNRTNDPNDNGFDIQDIFNQLSGGKTSGMNIGALLGKFSGGLDKDGDGDVDMKDLMGMFSGGGASGGGGLMDKMKGMFK